MQETDSEKPKSPSEHAGHQEARDGTSSPRSMEQKQGSARAAALDYWCAFHNMPVSMALLDEDGWILDVNARWQGFTVGDSDNSHGRVGSNYVASCRDSEDPVALEVHGLLAELQAGTRDLIEMEYSSQTSNQRRWFLMQAHRYAYEGHTGIVVLHVDVTPWRLAEQAESRRAETDALTGILNRRAFHSRGAELLAVAERKASSAAVIFLDIDGYKAINDEHGHEVGDHVLTAITARLEQSTRGSDIVARYGGDEFVVMAESIDSEGAARLADNLRQRLATPISVDGHRFEVTCSQGIAVYPANGGDLPSLIKAADTAMYQAKASGGGRSAFAVAG